MEENTRSAMDIFFKDTMVGKLLADTVNRVKYIRLTVEEENGLVKIRGIPAYVIKEDVKYIYKTTRIGNNIFGMLHNRGVDLYSFFISDFIIILDKMIDSPDGRTSVYTLNKIRDLLYKNTWVKDTLLEFKPTLDYKKVKKALFWAPLPHQQAFMEFYDKTKQSHGLNGQLYAAAPGA